MAALTARTSSDTCRTLYNIHKMIFWDIGYKSMIENINEHHDDCAGNERHFRTIHL